MSAYMVVFCKISDRARFIAEYGKPTAALIPKFGGEYLVKAPRVSAFEGAFGDGYASVISKWPDRAAIERFWNSPEYAPLKAVRQPLAQSHVLVVEAPI